MRWPEAKQIVWIVAFLLIGIGFSQTVRWYRTRDPIFDDTEYIVGVLAADDQSMHKYQAITDIASDDIQNYLTERNIDCPIRFQVNSTKHDPQTNLEIIFRWNEQGINLIIGPPWSSMIPSTISTTWKRGMLFLGQGSGSPLQSIDDSVFRLSVPYDKEGQVLAGILNKRRYESAVVLIDSDVWGTRLSYGFEKNFNGDSYLVKYNSRLDNYSSPLSDSNRILSDLRNNHVVVVVFPSGGLGDLINESSKYDRLSDTPWFTDQYGLDPAYLKINPYPKIDFNVTSYRQDIEDTKRDRSIESRYRELTGEDLDLHMLYVYDSCWLYTYAILETGTYNATMIKKALPIVAGEKGGVCGAIEFDSYGDRDKAQYQVYTLFISNGETETTDNEEIIVKFGEINRER